MPSRFDTPAKVGYIDTFAPLPYQEMATLAMYRDMSYQDKLDKMSAGLTPINSEGIEDTYLADGRYVDLSERKKLAQEYANDYNTKMYDFGNKMLSGQMNIDDPNVLSQYQNIMITGKLLSAYSANNKEQLSNLEKLQAKINAAGINETNYWYADIPTQNILDYKQGKTNYINPDLPIGKPLNLNEEWQKMFAGMQDIVYAYSNSDGNGYINSGKSGGVSKERISNLFDELFNESNPLYHHFELKRQYDIKHGLKSVEQANAEFIKNASDLKQGMITKFEHRIDEKDKKSDATWMDMWKWKKENPDPADPVFEEGASQVNQAVTRAMKDMEEYFDPQTMSINLSGIMPGSVAGMGDKNEIKHREANLLMQSANAQTAIYPWDKVSGYWNVMKGVDVNGNVPNYGTATTLYMTNGNIDLDKFEKNFDNLNTYDLFYPTSSVEGEIERSKETKKAQLAKLKEIKNQASIARSQIQGGEHLSDEEVLAIRYKALKGSEQSFVKSVSEDARFIDGMKSNTIENLGNRKIQILGDQSDRTQGYQSEFDLSQLKDKTGLTIEQIKQQMASNKPNLSINNSNTKFSGGLQYQLTNTNGKTFTIVVQPHNIISNIFSTGDYLTSAATQQGGVTNRVYWDNSGNPHLMNPDGTEGSGSSKKKINEDDMSMRFTSMSKIINQDGTPANVSSLSNNKVITFGSLITVEEKINGKWVLSPSPSGNIYWTDDEFYNDGKKTLTQKNTVLAPSNWNERKPKANYYTSFEETKPDYKLEDKQIR